MLGLSVLAFAFTFWLGLYLLARNPANGLMRLTGVGVLAYAVALAVENLHALWPIPDFIRWFLILLPATLWACVLVMLGRHWPTPPPRRPVGLIVTATLFFGLGLGLIVFPLNWLPPFLVLLAISLDFVGLGLAIAMLDAFDEGETLVADMMRSLVTGALAALIFGGPISLAMLLSTGVTPATFTLLTLTLASALTWHGLGDAIQGWLDRMVFARTPGLIAERAELRAVTSALPRAAPTSHLAQLEEAEFVRLTRRALSHMSDLSKLTTSPLIHLPQVAARLAARHAQPDSLERAQELRAVLAQAVLRLRPHANGQFGTSEEWRYFNSLYFPYVLGLKPFANQPEAIQLEGNMREILEWFRTSVPERTLYNWQTTAARLVAKTLREQWQTLAVSSDYLAD